MNLGNLDFDIVSYFDIRISYFAGLGIFTTVESALQIRLFMQNEPKFRKSQMNISDYITREYEQLDTWPIGKNEPKTNPNEPKFKKAKMNVSSFLTKAYGNISNWAIYENEPNTNPICRGVASGEAGTNPISVFNHVKLRNLQRRLSSGVRKI